MSSYFQRWIWVRLLLIQVLLLFIESAYAQQTIVNPAISPSMVSRSEARAIFAMRRKDWPDGTSIQVYVFPDNHPLHNAFCKKVLGIFPHQLRRIWDRHVFSGTGQAPHVVLTAEEMREQVANTPGAIGYLREDDINDTVKPVPVLKVQ